MSENENATKAPESDAQESPAPAPSAEPAASEHCVTDRPTPSGQSSTGEIIKLNDIDVYISKPTDYPHVPSKLLLLLTGGTGIRSVNNQIQADRYASEGSFLVLMPDLFGGDTAPGPAIADDSTSLIEQFKIKAVEVTKSFLIDMWLARITADKVMPILHKVIEAAREEYADSVQRGDGVYAVGYCVGGRFVTLLAKGTKREGDEETGTVTEGPYIKAGAIAHAASVIPEDFEDLKAPLSFVCVENDPLFPEEVRTGAEDVMSKGGLEHEVKVYPGVPHGFAVVGEYPDASIKDAQATAFEQMLGWIKDR